MQPLLGNQRPDLLTSLMNMSLVLRVPREMHLARSSAYVPRLPSFLKLLQNPHVLLTFDHCACHAKQDLYVQKCSIHQFFRTIDFDFEMCFAPQRRALFSTSQLPEVASRHNGVHFFDISTSKSGPSMRFFCTC